MPHVPKRIADKVFHQPPCYQSMVTDIGQGPARRQAAAPIGRLRNKSSDKPRNLFIRFSCNQNNAANDMEGSKHDQPRSLFPEDKGDSLRRRVGIHRNAQRGVGRRKLRRDGDFWRESILFSEYWFSCFLEPGGTDPGIRDCKAGENLPDSLRRAPFLTRRR